MLVRRLCISALLSAVVLVLISPTGATQEAEETSPIHAVLFFSPTCGHCEYVIQEVLPSLFDEHGGVPWEVYFSESPDGVSFYLLTNGTLEFLLVDVTVPDGFALFDGATTAFAIGNEAVPRLIIGGEVAIGSLEIPERLPAIIEAGLAGDGIAWPDLPGVEAAVASIPIVPLAAPTTTAGVTPESTTSTIAAMPIEGTTTTAPLATEVPTSTVPLIEVLAGDQSFGERFGRDVVGNGAAVLVLLGMIAGLVWVGLRARAPAARAHTSRKIALLALAGLGVAAYLSWIEINSATAVCGPVGDCNAVQQSDYASIAGVPIGVLGLGGYLALLAMWVMTVTGVEIWVDRSRVLLFGIATIGVVFSIYLTFLEPFVIGATCIWCLASAVIITLIMLLSAGPGIEAWKRLFRRPVVEASGVE